MSRRARARPRAGRRAPAAGQAVIDFVGSLTMGRVLTGVIILGGALTYLLGGWAWLSGQVVWASQFQQVVGDFNCQFADLKRTQLEGQLADADFRISSASSKKILSSEEAQDLARLKVQRDQIQRRLNALPDCYAAPQGPQQRQQPGQAPYRR